MIFKHFLVSALGLLIFLAPARANQTREKDLNQDGITDQRLIYDDAGTILRVETDADQDAFAEEVRLYLRGRISKILRDTDQDRAMDCLDYISDEKRTRQERLNPNGDLIQLTLFDPRGLPLKMTKDTTGDLKHDTLYRFEKGEVTASEQDLTGDGRTNAWTDFAHQCPVLRKTDSDGDGQVDQFIHFDPKGRACRIEKQPLTHACKHFGQVLFLENGTPVEQHKDTNADGRVDMLTRYKKGRPASMDKDINLDGTYDYFAIFDDCGRMEKSREDTDFNGTMDRKRHYRAGELVKTLNDGDGDGFFETCIHIKKGRVTQTLMDKNKDGTPDLKITHGKEGKPVLSLADTDFNGFFETRQDYTAKGRVVSLDRNQDKRAEIRSTFEKGLLVKKEMDTDGDGSMDQMEFYGAGEVLVRMIEDKPHRPLITWYYENGDLPSRAQEDTDRDGAVDIWYWYHADGSLAQVHEDTNRDGKADLWETYDKSQAVVKRQRDLDFDGQVDFTDASPPT